MRVFTSSLSEMNRIQIGEKLYFLKHNDRQTLALFSECPHRGGPLHYGKQSDNGSSIVCPWHENKLKICNLTRQSLCIVRVMDELKFLIPEKAQVTVWKELPLREQQGEGA